MRQYLYKWLDTTEFRQIKHTYPNAEWVPNPDKTSSTERIFHVDFQAKDYYKMNHELMDEIVRVGIKLAEEQPESYGLAPGVLKREHVEDIAKDLLDSARSGFRVSVRSDRAAAPDSTEQKEKKERDAERQKLVSN